MSEGHPAARARPRVIVAGSGVAAVEAVLALGALAEPLAIEIELVAPEDHFLYRPLAVVEPFGYPPPYRLPLDRLERTHGVRHRRDALARVDADAHRVTLAGGGELEFDALVVATGVIGAELTVTTPQREPLALLGSSAGRVVRDLLGNRGVRLLTDAQVVSLRHDGATLADGRPVAADRVVTLPRLVGNPVPGLPADADGFVPIDEHGAVAGLRDVYAVGDVTAFPVKQGSVAAHQADAAAAAIAARLGARVAPAPFEPIIQAVLLTGVTARYLQADLSGTGPGISTVGIDPLWWPPEKIAAQFLASYLAEQPDLAEIPELAVRGPRPANEEQYRQQQPARAEIRPRRRQHGPTRRRVALAAGSRDDRRLTATRTRRAAQPLGTRAAWP